jgi:hypothetical protein
LTWQTDLPSVKSIIEQGFAEVRERRFMRDQIEAGQLYLWQLAK